MKHKTFRGKIVDMEAIRRSHEQTIATGNMGVNAKGDKLGKGGKVIETAQTRARKHYTTTSTSQNKMSVKGDRRAEEIFEDEKTAAPKKTTGDRNSKTGTSNTEKRKKVEREAENGDIFLEEAPEIQEDPE